MLTGGRLALPEGLVDDGWLAVADGRISGIGTGTPPPGDHVELGGALVVPGFIDTHCHGGGGGSFSSAETKELQRAITAHRRHGTTTMLASLVSEPIRSLVDQLAALRELVEDGELAGVHLEGPFIAEARCGAHDPAVLLEPDTAAVDALLRAGHGAVRMVTLAPELAGGVRAVRQLTESGVIAAIGHTDGTEEQIRPAIDAGATVGTHLFNGMRPLHHREPGPIGALLDDERVTVELICDLVHVHPTVLRLAATYAGRGRTVLITDAMSATDAADGRYQLGRLEVDVRDGVATLADTGSLAGSTLTMDVAFRNLVRGAGLGIPDAVRATSGRPAELLGIEDRTGSLETGLTADIVILDEDLRPSRVLRGGEWVS
ncbi:N-acetylglucosamine-6-phosphate deacetylase [Amycolatopsis acidiphila]|uniref:N-acetylglucosamine-6-phosphate deacetylase n=1 Tax=Amycolatopsis acidiphila TaxID=715473 RepID=A0A558AGY6_9PSEU|nr:N-acetylglucosamine-6-phosphate deacetylase [Amycolatopsis acidiphila]TVT23534.1 N-acetylglucosamine-6-phosphate deacetylase [Amycolatopsis acidiphila]UIJ64129.1 N-acetylglucosamine-6-phosphate deacetylase [Amycolatopsis acidiphila]